MSLATSAGRVPRRTLPSSGAPSACVLRSCDRSLDSSFHWFIDLLRQGRSKTPWITATRFSSKLRTWLLIGRPLV